MGGRGLAQGAYAILIVLVIHSYAQKVNVQLVNLRLYIVEYVSITPMPFL